MGRRDLHKIDVVIGVVGQDKLDIDITLSKRLAKMITSYPEAATVVRWQFPAKH
jgi:hypothetical protein